jgi:hypothetical protein
MALKNDVLFVDIKSQYAKDFEVLLKSWVGEAFIIDFHGGSFADHPSSHEVQLLIARENNHFVGGAVVSRRLIFNDFKSDQYREVAEQLSEEGYSNFSYFCIKKDKRNLGFASLVLSYISKHKVSCWLACDSGLIGFYTSRGFEVVIDADECNSAILRTKAF